MKIVFRVYFQNVHGDWREGREFSSYEEAELYCQKKAEAGFTLEIKKLWIKSQEIS